MNFGKNTSSDVKRMPLNGFLPMKKFNTKNVQIILHVAVSIVLDILLKFMAIERRWSSKVYSDIRTMKNLLNSEDFLKREISEFRPEYLAQRILSLSYQSSARD